jgi:hypothetical protein
MRLLASNQAKRRDFFGKRTLRRHHNRTRFVCTAEQPKSALCRSKRIRRIKMARTNVPEGQLPSHGTLVPWARGVHARSAPERSSSSPLLRWLDCSTPVFTMPDLHVHDPDPDPGVHDAPI